MKVLMCHDYYRLPGGEDQVFHDECCLLEQNGHDVVRYTKSNSELDKMGRFDMAKKTIWNREVERELKGVIRQARPDLVHFHNTFPLISPSAYAAAKQFNIPVVQTLHNYRTICPGSTLLRADHICKKCISKKFPWPSIQHGCYRNNRMTTSVVAFQNAIHRSSGTWSKAVDAFIALTHHSRSIFIEAGFPAKKLKVKPNFVYPDPGQRQHEGNFAVYVGRLSQEKGIHVLLQAWQNRVCKLPLVIVGDGPQRNLVEQAAKNDPNITFVGQKSFDRTLEIIREAKLLVMPSIWYETFGRTMIEAFAAGIPVIASNIGAMLEIVINNQTGLHFEVGSSEDLARKINTLWNDDELRRSMGQNARETYCHSYTADKNYENLINIYDEILCDN